MPARSTALFCGSCMHLPHSVASWRPSSVGQHTPRTIIPTQVSGVLHQADTALASCRRWLPNATLSDLRRDLASARRAVKATAEQHPGQDRLPRPTFVDDGEPCVLDRTCAGCNRSSVHLQACAACRAVYYCRHVRMVS